MKNKKEEKSHSCKSCKNCNCNNSLSFIDKKIEVEKPNANSTSKELNTSITYISNNFKNSENANTY